MSNDDLEDFDDDDFDFLDDQEFDEEPETGPIATQSTNSRQSSLLQKKYVLIAGITVVAAIFVLTNKQSKPELSIEAQTTTPEKVKTVELPSPELGQNLAQTPTPAPVELVAPKQSEPVVEEPTRTENLQEIADALNVEEEDLFSNFKLSKPVPAETEALQTIAKNTDNQELKEVIDSLTKEMTENFNQIKTLQDSLIDIEKNLSSVSEYVNNMQNQILTLTKSVNSVTQTTRNESNDFADGPPGLSAASNIPERPLVYSTPEYIVHAIIPGRAWLKSTAGQIITITEGDSLGDYGKIAVIDAANNIVRTSSGISFR